MNRFDKASKEWDIKPTSLLVAQTTSQGILEYLNLDHMDILDYGCGTGLLGFSISDNAKSVLGMDNSIGMVEVFNQKATQYAFLNAKAVQHNINNENLPTNTFDVIVSSMTLHHIKDVDDFFKKCKAALKPNGYLCISDLDKEDGTFHAKHNNEGVEHFGFSQDEIKKLYQDNDFNLLSLKVICSIEQNSRNYPIFLSIGRL